MRERMDLVGQKFNRLMVVSFAGTKGGRSYFRCICDCGKEHVSGGKNLIRGNVKSCGCLKSEKIKVGMNYKHGMVYSSEYRSYNHMKERCNNPKSKDYKNYGGRGIKVCKRWMDSFENFLEDMGTRPGKEYSLERGDNDGDYEPNNCKWATRKEQQGNTRNNHWLEYNGKRMIISDWERYLNFPENLLHQRITVHKWSIKRALTTPVRGITKP